ncbi:MAG: FAD-dependent oxidoreductase [Hungatella sp.]|nr:FAD-dependent oxidoreductase [Hungatella sp.]
MSEQYDVISSAGLGKASEVILDKVREYLPEKKEYDVIVAGGGPAGIGAAVAARMQGAETLLLEASSTLGGVAAAAMWMPVNRITLWGVTPEGGKRGGVHDLFVDAVRSYGAQAYTERRHPATDMRGGLSIHPDYLKMAMFQLLERNGCRYRLYSPVTDVIMENHCIKGVSVRTKSGEDIFRGKIVIDCTGDGDVAYRAGVNMKKGREEDGRMLPPALLWTVGNVDLKRFFRFFTGERERFEEIIKEAGKEGYITCKWYDFDETSIADAVNVNNGGVNDWGNIDMTDEGDMTVAERLGIQAALDFCTFVKKKRVPGMEDCCLLRAGYRVAVRDTRRIDALYNITHEDAVSAPEFPDMVSRRYGFIDAVGYYGAEMKSGHAYPYRCLVPKGVKNLLVAGRCAGATHLGFASGRGMGENMGMGQAAGVAAVEAIRQKKTPDQIEVKKVQDILRAMGVK